MASLTWLHLSDLHACHPRHGWDAARVMETLVDDLRRLQSQHGLRPDFLFFTGDAAFGQLGHGPGQALSDQLQVFGTFLDAVCDAFDPPIAKDAIFMVPGNHDVNRDHVGDDQTEWLETRETKGDLDKVTQMIQAGKIQWRRYMDRLSDYREFLKTRDLDHLIDDPERLIYSTVHTVRDIRVGIAGFNTAWSCCRPGEKGHLWMAGKWQQGHLRAGLAESDVSIALMHHPPDWLVEFENPDFGRGLEQDFHFLLHGHEHRDWVLSTDTGYSVIAAGACYEHSKTERNGYNVVRLDLERKRGEVWLRRFEASGGGWTARLLGGGKTDDRGVRPLRLEGLLRNPHAALHRSASGSETADHNSQPTAEQPTNTPPPISDFDRYLQRLRAAHRDLPLAGFETRVRLPIQIQDVYIPLRARLHHAVMESRQVALGSLRETESLDLAGAEDREIPFDQAIQMAARSKRRGVVVLGNPGSGKTTLLKHFALAATDPMIGPAALALPADTVPVLIELRRLRDPAAGLLPALEDAVGRTDIGLDAVAFVRHLVRDHTLLILVDGLDEVADEAERAAVSRWLEEALQQLPESTFVVTSRFAVYKRNARLDGRFLELHVLDIEETAARRFIHAWYLAVESQAELGRALDASKEEAQRGADDLIGKIFTPADLRTLNLSDLATNPLMLQILCLVHRDHKQLPERRVELYRECVNVLLELWRRAKEMPLTFDAQQALRLLQPLAWHLHAGERREAELKELLPYLEGPLQELRRAPEDGRALLEAIRDQSGVLVSLGQQAYGFLHLSFQEYLAALYVQDRHSAEPQILQRLAEQFGDPWWREVILLSLGLNNPSLFEPLMTAVIDCGRLGQDVALADDCLRDALATSAHPFLRALHHGIDSTDTRYHTLRLLRAMPGWETAEIDGAEGKSIVRRYLEDTTPQVRGMAAELLAVDAPPRHLKTEIDRGERVHTADGSVLVYVPGGHFTLGTDDDLEAYLDANKDWPKPQHRVELSPYWIGKYPVTNAQYRRFMKAHPQHQEPKFWNNSQFNEPEQPVVGISWDDAMSYCRWAGLTLPSEAQWEAAARGAEGRLYPWGDASPTAQHANFDRREGHTTPVGAYPLGAGPYGTLDQAGNVWEWCQDAWSEDAYARRDGQVDPVQLDSTSFVRVVRGGSWADGSWLLPSAFRLRDGTGSRFRLLGFRVLCGSAPEA